MTSPRKPTKILVVDVGGTHVKVRVTGQRDERKIPSGSAMTATRMVRDVKRIVKDWKYEVISLGYPGPVIHGPPVQEPHSSAGATQSRRRLGWI
jgi:polyphosphate glucokinase